MPEFGIKKLPLHGYNACNACTPRAGLIVHTDPAGKQRKLFAGISSVKLNNSVATAEAATHIATIAACRCVIAYPATHFKT
jgi:hypothetical protein